MENTTSKGDWDEGTLSLNHIFWRTPSKIKEIHEEHPLLIGKLALKGNIVVFMAFVAEANARRES